MEPYPHHYVRQSRQDDSVDPNLKFVLEELQKMEVYLGDRIKGCCVGLETPVVASEQCAKERLISLEMACIDAETGHADMAKQVDGLKLEVNRINHFLECESLANP
jgi:hypothetical protein